MSMPIGINLTQIDATSQFKLGTVFEVQSTTGPMSAYKYVRYISGPGNVAAVIGQVAYYRAGDGYASGFVTSDLSNSENIGAGVLQAVIPNNQHGWIQTRGFANLTIALTGGADGNALTAVGATDGTLDVSAAVTDAVCAYAITAANGRIVCCFPY